MSHEEAATKVLLERLGIAVTQDARRGGWGWSMQTDKITRPWVGTYATSAEAAGAALAWLLDAAWRGVLCPILHAAASDERPAPTADDAELLGPWVRALQPATPALE
ncbi:MAG TPA: hypothetical protein VNL77_07155 [Roseiflexaceae bacterium]|nr:hypothetical protein [Roseiflexaceae bacterium]